MAISQSHSHAETGVKSHWKLWSKQAATIALQTQNMKWSRHASTGGCMCASNGIHIATKLKHESQQIISHLLWQTEDSIRKWLIASTTAVPLQHQWAHLTDRSILYLVTPEQPCRYGTNGHVLLIDQYCSWLPLNSHAATASMGTSCWSICIVGFAGVTAEWDHFFLCNPHLLTLWKPPEGRHFQASSSLVSLCQPKCMMFLAIRS